jgi:putative ABC transport system substrate-binding protein
MRRREFIKILGGATAAWPFTARAQQPGMPLIGWLNVLSPATTTRFIAAFHQGLKETGYVEGQNLAIEYRWADGQYAQLPAMASDLVRRQVAAIYAVSPPAVLAAMAATTTIPIVFLSGLDPVKAGFVRSLSVPGGNVSGVSLMTSSLSAKRLESCASWRPQSEIARSYHAAVEPMLSREEAEREVRLGLESLVWQRIIEVVKTGSRNNKQTGRR